MLSAPIDWCPHGYARRSCESCAEVAALLAQVRDLKARVKKLEEALREIARGKSPEDVGCLADEWLLMAGRLVGIARAALTAKEET